MEHYPIIAVGIATMIIILAVLAFFANRKQQELYKKTGKRPQGHYLGLGIAAFLPFGIVFGIILGNIALGIPFGLAIGIAVGTAWERQHAKELRPLTEEERKARRVALVGGIVALVIGIAVFVVTLFLV
ncbi:hypothetical protein JXB02_05115 [Candidatus Woesearchaeota archaeon]|nr:hypothetical protein [Candidatus Woesearchaeota archaeon]